MSSGRWSWLKRRPSRAYAGCGVHTVRDGQILRYGAGDGRAKVLSWESQGRERASATCRLSGGRLTVLMVGTDATGRHRSLELQVVETTAMPCNFGGKKRFFICPGHVRELEEMGIYNTLGDGGGCGRRVGKLYCPPGGKQFMCWRCHDLAYLSTRVTADVRLGRRAWGIRQRLGQRDPAQPFPPRPRGMHGRTYNRLRAECMAYETAGAWLTMERFAGTVSTSLSASAHGT